MCNDIQTALRCCIDRARRGESKISVFDLMYETNLAYPELNRALDGLAEQNEIIRKDAKTVEFIGDLNREIAEPPAAEEDFVDGDYIKVLKFCIEKGNASASSIQRNFPIGFMKACRIVDWMEQKGYISQCEDSKPREILISLNTFNTLYGDRAVEEESFDNFDLDNLFKTDDSTEDEEDEPSDFDLDEYLKTINSEDGESEEKTYFFGDDWYSKSDFAGMFKLALNRLFSWEEGPRKEIMLYNAEFKFSTGDTVKFRLDYKDGFTSLSDNGFAVRTLASRNYFGYTRAKNKIIKFIDGKRVEFKDGELHLNTGLYTCFNDFMYLYAIVEGLLGS